MGFRAVTYNVAGAKFLELPEELPKKPIKKHPMTRGEYRDKLHDALHRLTNPHDPTKDAPDHLTTLKGEREGSPDKDVAASKVRRTQLDVVLNGIISRYNEWVPGAIKKQRHEKDPKFERRPAVWVLGGDFNCIPTSPEIVAMKQPNFIDLNPNKGGGAKGTTVPIEAASITLDYLFAGPAFYSIDPYLAEQRAQNNPLPLEYRVSDHLPVLADVPILPT